MSRIKYTISNAISISALIFLSLSGCFNMRSNSDNPQPLPNQISYDEYANQTAGIIGLTDDGCRFVLTRLAVDKYNALIKKYSDITRLNKNEGIKRYEKDNKLYTIEMYAFYEFLRLSKIDKNKQ